MDLARGGTGMVERVKGFDPLSLVEWDLGDTSGLGGSTEVVGAESRQSVVLPRYHPLTAS